jgi:hypothetical protein
MPGLADDFRHNPPQRYPTMVTSYSDLHKGDGNKEQKACFFKRWKPFLRKSVSEDRYRHIRPNVFL